MVDYAQFYVDPRPYSDSALGRLAATMTDRDRMAQAQAQQDKENRLAMEKYQSDLQQQAFSNRLAMGNLDVNQQNADTNAGNLAVTQGKADEEKRTAQMETAYGLMAAVRGPQDWPTFVEQATKAIEQGDLPPSTVEELRRGYDPKRFEQIKQGLAAKLGKEVFNPAMAGPGGSMLQTNAITGELKVPLSRAPLKPVTPDPNAPLTKVQALKLSADTFDRTANMLMDPETKLVRNGPEGEPDLYRDQYNKLLAANDKDQQDINSGKSNYPERVSKIVQEIEQTQNEVKAWNDYVQKKAPDPTLPGNQIKDEKPVILNFYHKGKIEKYVSDGTQWVPYNPGGRKPYGK